MTIGAYSAVQSQAMQPYIYNSKQVTSASLNKIQKTDFDPTSSPFDFGSLTGETTNPLAKGETKDWAGVIASQMAMSANRAAMIMVEE